MVAVFSLKIKQKLRLRERQVIDLILLTYILYALIEHDI